MRHFRRDSLYEHAKSAFRNDPKFAIVNVKSGEEWIDAFFTSSQIFKGYDFILEEVKTREGKNTGYFQVEQSDILCLSVFDV